jgi:membrane-associated protease RseP (regulator of RpoE activity)
VSNWTVLGNLIKDVAPGTKVSVSVRRDDQLLTLHPVLAQVPGRPGGYMGIAPATVFQIAGPLGAIRYAGSFYGEVLSGTGQALANIPSATMKLFSKQRSDDANDQIGSVIAFGQQTSDAVDASAGWQYKVEVVLLLAAELNIILGLGNILPLMPLDGGLAVVVIWEGVRGWFARRRGRPEPGPVDIRKLVPVMVSIFMVVVLFSVVVMAADILNPLQLGQ